MMFVTERMARVLPLALVSIDMFRAAVLSIVLTLTAGSNASLLCAVWCHPEAAATGQCAHPDSISTPIMTAKDSCPDIAVGSTAVVREDVRRGASTPHAQQAVAVPPFQVAPPPSHPTSARESGQRSPFEARPAVFTLRI